VDRKKPVFLKSNGEPLVADKPNVILQPSGRRGEADDWKNLRTVARELGVDIESICAENATCGKCKVVVEEAPLTGMGLPPNART